MTYLNIFSKSSVTLRALITASGSHVISHQLGVLGLSSADMKATVEGVIAYCMDNGPIPDEKLAEFC